jgi:hypothetical protein
MQKTVWLLLLVLLISACGGDSGESPGNTAPTLTRNFADISAAVDDTRSLDLVTYFDDRQQDASTLEYEVLSSDPAVVAASLVSGSILDLNFASIGTATVTVTATDGGGLSTSDSFDVTVSQDGGGNGGTNTPPTSLDLPNQTLQTSAPNASLDLADFFDDAEDGAQGLSYAAQSSDPNVVVVSTSGGTLTLQAQGAGTATVTVTARDSSGATISESFTVTVEDDGGNGNGGGNGTNTRPSLVTPLEDRNIGADDLTVIDLSDYFDDVEDGSEGLIYSANSSDDNVVVATVNGTTLTLDPRNLGTAEITITATDSEGLTIEDTFVVTVSNQPLEDPFQVRFFETVTAFVAEADRLINLSGYFDDNQDGSEGLTYTVESDNTAVVTATIDPDGTNLRLDFGIEGTAAVTVTATDSDGNSVEATFFVIVQGDSSEAPVAEDINVETDENTPVDITLIATDPDGDTLTYTVESQPANGTLSGTAPNLTYTPDAGFTGTDTFTYSASDGENISNIATVTITVNEVAAGNPRFEFVAGSSPDQVLVRLVDYPGEWLGFSFDVGSGGNVTLQNPPFGAEGTGVGNFLAVSNGTNDRSPITVGGATTTPLTGGGEFVILNLEGSGTDTLTISNGTLLVDDQGNEISVEGDSIEVTLAGGGNGGGNGGGGGNPTFTMTAGPAANQVTVALENYTGTWFSFTFSTSGTVSVDGVQGNGIGGSLLTSTGPAGTVGVGVSPISDSGDIIILTVSGTGTLTIGGGEILTDLSAADGAPVSVSGSSITLP